MRFTYCTLRDLYPVLLISGQANMIKPALFKTAGRLTGSMVISFLLFWLTMLVPAGFTRLIWLLPGKVVAPVLAAILPQSWVTGDMASDTHWHVVSGGGFALLSGILFWALLIFGIWHWLGLKKAKAQL